MGLIDAYTSKLRAKGDNLTRRQRRADALTALAVAAGDKTRPSHGTPPAAVVMTISLTEAERTARGRDRRPQQLPLDADYSGAGGADSWIEVTDDDTRAFSRRTAEAAAAAGAAAQAGVEQQARAPGAGSAVELTPPGSLGSDATLGDAAARFGLCSAPITPVVVAQPDSLIARLTDTRIEPLALGRGQRLASAGQRKALMLRDRGCVIEGCEVPAQQCQVHHVHDWSLGGATDLENLALACWVHHRQTELKRWRLIWTGNGWKSRPTPRHTWLTAAMLAA